MGKHIKTSLLTILLGVAALGIFTPKAEAYIIDWTNQIVIFPNYSNPYSFELYDNTYYILTGDPNAYAIHSTSDDIWGGFKANITTSDVGDGNNILGSWYYYDENGFQAYGGNFAIPAGYANGSWDWAWDAGAAIWRLIANDFSPL